MRNSNKITGGESVGYVVLGNSTKPTPEKRASREKVKISNVLRIPAECALECGYEVFVGVNRDNPEQLEFDIPIKAYDANSYRSITAVKDNYQAYKNLCKLIREKNIQVIHCNTPIGGMVARFAGKRCKVKKVIYTVHGFHFYKGASLFNRTVLKWSEKLMARWTDAIITINTEDYEVAKKMKLRRGGRVYYLPGVGVDTSDFAPNEIIRAEKRAELGFSPDDIVVISAGNLNANKNNRVILSAMAHPDAKNVHYLVCGVGEKLDELKAQAQALGIADRVRFLGFRTDIKELMQASDVFAMPSYREGLSRAMMEAMAAGLPCVASKIRGNTDLIDEGKGGFLCNPDDVEGFTKAITCLATDGELVRSMREYNLSKIHGYDTEIVREKLRAIYDELLDKKS